MNRQLQGEITSENKSICVNIALFHLKNLTISQNPESGKIPGFELFASLYTSENHYVMLYWNLLIATYDLKQQ